MMIAMDIRIAPHIFRIPGVSYKQTLLRMSLAHGYFRFFFFEQALSNLSNAMMPF